MSLVLVENDMETSMVESEDPRMPAVCHPSRIIGLKAAIELEGRIAQCGFSGETLSLCIPSPPGDLREDVGAHISIYNRPRNAHNNVQYNPPDLDKCKQLHWRLFEFTWSFESLSIFSGSEENDVQTGVAYYVSVALTSSAVSEIKELRKKVGLPIDPNQLFGLTIAGLAPSFAPCHARSKMASLNPNLNEVFTRCFAILRHGDGKDFRGFNTESWTEQEKLEIRYGRANRHIQEAINLAQDLEDWEKKEVLCKTLFKSSGYRLPCSLHDASTHIHAPSQDSQWKVCEEMEHWCQFLPVLQQLMRVQNRQENPLRVGMPVDSVSSGGQCTFGITASLVPFQPSIIFFAAPPMAGTDPHVKPMPASPVYEAATCANSSMVNCLIQGNLTKLESLQLQRQLDNNCDLARALLHELIRIGALETASKHGWANFVVVKCVKELHWSEVFAIFSAAESRNVVNLVELAFHEFGYKVVHQILLGYECVEGQAPFLESLAKRLITADNITGQRDNRGRELGNWVLQRFIEKYPPCWDLVHACLLAVHKNGEIKPGNCAAGHVLRCFVECAPEGLKHFWYSSVDPALLPNKSRKSRECRVSQI